MSNKTTSVTTRFEALNRVKEDILEILKSNSEKARISKGDIPILRELMSKYDISSAFDLLFKLMSIRHQQFVDYTNCPQLVLFFSKFGLFELTSRSGKSWIVRNRLQHLLYVLLSGGLSQNELQVLRYKFNTGTFFSNDFKQHFAAYLDGICQEGELIISPVVKFVLKYSTELELKRSTMIDEDVLI